MRYEFELKGVTEFMDALAAAPIGIREASYKAMQKSVMLLEAEAKGRVPRRTGRLFSSIDGQVRDAGLEGRVGTSVSYARYVEFGTTPHEIAAGHAEALRFEIGGTVHFAQRVLHPGARAARFLGEALEAGKSRIVDYFRDAAAEVAHDLGKD